MHKEPVGGITDSSARLSLALGMNVTWFNNEGWALLGRFLLLPSAIVVNNMRLNMVAWLMDGHIAEVLFMESHCVHHTQEMRCPHFRDECSS